MTNTSRLLRKNRDDLELLSGGLLDLADSTFKDYYRINNSEYYFICEYAPEEELNILIPGPSDPNTFSHKKLILNTLSKLIDRYNNQNKEL